jgi:K+-sensing histidine kinase KdpD
MIITSDEIESIHKEVLEFDRSPDGAMRLRFRDEHERVYGGGRGQRTAAMHGKLALYHSQYGVIPIAMSLLAIIWTTAFLTWTQTYLVADDVEDLALAYLLPTIFIAVFFGSTLAVAGSFVSALAATYFLYPPKLSFYIADPAHAAELGFILLLSVTASKAIGVMTDDRRR